MSKKIENNKAIRELSPEELSARIQDDEMRIKKMAFAHSITPLENPMALRGMRREIARMKTELNKRQLGF